MQKQYDRLVKRQVERCITVNDQQFRAIRKISDRALRRIWQEIDSNKPMPRIDGYVMSNKNMNYIVAFLDIDAEFKTDLIEHGRSLSPEETGGITMPLGKTYCIFVRNAKPSGILSIFRHELKHISQRDFKRYIREMKSNRPTEKKE